MRGLRGLLFAAWLPLLVDVAEARPSKHTANYVKGHGEELVDRKVSIDVSWVQPLRWANTEGVAYYVAHTWDERERVPGGMITVAIAEDMRKKFLDKYHTSPDVEGRGDTFDLDSRRLTGVLRAGTENGGGLFLDLTGGDADSPGAILGGRIKEFFSRLRSDKEAG